MNFDKSCRCELIQYYVSGEYGRELSQDGLDMVDYELIRDSRFQAFNLKPIPDSDWETDAPHMELYEFIEGIIQELIGEHDIFGGKHEN